MFGKVTCMLCIKDPEVGSNFCVDCNEYIAELKLKREMREMKEMTRNDRNTNLTCGGPETYLTRDIYFIDSVAAVVGL